MAPASPPAHYSPRHVRRRCLDAGQIRHDEDGQGLAEYALILSLIAIVAIAALVFLGSEISSLLSSIGAAL